MSDVLPIVNAIVLGLQTPILVYFVKHFLDKINSQEVRQNQMDVILASDKEKIENNKERLAILTIEISKMEGQLDEILNITSSYNQKRGPK